MSDITDLAAGLAAEHLVVADLLLGGYRAFLSSQNAPYNVILQDGDRMIRIQVRSTREPRYRSRRTVGAKTYMWFVHRAGKSGAKRYAPGEFDMLALVALDIRAIAYWPQKLVRSGTIFLRPPTETQAHGNLKLKPVDQYPIFDALKEI